MIRLTVPTARPTRVEFDPPSLRHQRRGRMAGGVRRNEGRIRPSFIEAFGVRPGAVNPSATRVEFDPPSLRQPLLQAQSSRLPANEGRIRPSFIEALFIILRSFRLCGQRGSNSTLLH